MMNAAPSALPSEQLSVLHALFDLIELLKPLLPLDATLAAAIEDLQRREAVLGEREARLIKRETAIKMVLADFGADP
jgi:hypothetical protein